MSRPLSTRERVAFVEALRATGEVRAAAGAAGIDFRRVYAARKTDDDLAGAIEIAREAWRAEQLRRVEQIALTPTPGKPAGDWQAILALVNKHDERRDGALRRTKLRAEIDALRAKANGLLPPDITVTVSDPAAVSAIFRQHFGDEGHRPQIPAPAHDPRAADGAHDVGEPVLPVPAGVDR